MVPYMKQLIYTQKALEQRIFDKTISFILGKNLNIKLVFISAKLDAHLFFINKRVNCMY